MESEIFLTLLIKFCEPDKLPWQRAIAVEVLHKICWRARQLRDICRHYDLDAAGATPIFEQLITALSSLSGRLFQQIHRRGGDQDAQEKFTKKKNFHFYFQKSPTINRWKNFIQKDIFEKNDNRSQIQRRSSWTSCRLRSWRWTRRLEAGQSTTTWMC